MLESCRVNDTIVEMSNNSKKPPQIAIYCRVSTSQQDFELQMNDLNKEAKKMGSEIFHVYTDTIGGATQTTERRYAEDVIRDAADGKFQILLVWRIDRIARDEEHGLSYLRRIEETGCNIQFITQPFINTPVPHTPMADSMVKNMRVMLFTGARMELENIRARVRAAKTNWIKANRWPSSIIPDGYLLDTEGGRYTLKIDPARAPIIKRLFSMYIDDGLSIREICKKLNNKGVPAATARKGKWVKDSIQDKLSNSVYIGKLPINGKKLGPIHTFTCPPIISDDRFAEAQQIKVDRMARSKRNLKREYPFRPYLSCFSCGHDLHSICSGRDKNISFTIHYGFRKPNKEVKFKKRCPDGCGRISEIKLVGALYQHVAKFVMNSSVAEITDWIKNTSKMPTSAKEDLVVLNAQLNGLYDDAELVTDLYPRYIKTKKKLDDRIKKIDFQIKTVAEKIRDIEQTQIGREEESAQTERLTRFSKRFKQDLRASILRLEREVQIKDSTGKIRYDDIEPDYKDKRNVAVETLKFIKNMAVDFEKRRIHIITRTQKYLDGEVIFEPDPVRKLGRPSKPKDGGSCGNNGPFYKEINAPITVAREN